MPRTRRWRRECGRGRSTSSSGRSTWSGEGTCCAARSRTGGGVDDPLGTAWQREDDTGPADRPGYVIAFRPTQCRERRRRRPAAQHRGGPPASAQAASGPSSSSTRSIASTRRQQDAVLPHVEEGIVTLIGATTENPSFEVNAALLSRSPGRRPGSRSPTAIVAEIIDRALVDPERGLGHRAGRPRG